MKNTLYIFSGLGADERVFKKIHFTDSDVHFVQWIRPLKNESLESYAERLGAVVTAENPVLIGLSFGGMIASEIAAKKSSCDLILISSAGNRNEIPLSYRAAGFLKLHRLLPAGLLKTPGKFTSRLFGVKSDEEKKLLQKILHDTDPHFLRWAMNAIIRWKRVKSERISFRLHGDNDKILPLPEAAIDFEIHDGGHFMVFGHADEISSKLNKFLSERSARL